MSKREVPKEEDEDTGPGEGGRKTERDRVDMDVVC